MLRQSLVLFVSVGSLFILSAARLPPGLFPALAAGSVLMGGGIAAFMLLQRFGVGRVRPGIAPGRCGQASQAVQGVTRALIGNHSAHYLSNQLVLSSYWCGIQRCLDLGGLEDLQGLRAGKGY